MILISFNLKNDSRFYEHDQATQESDSCKKDSSVF